MSIENEKINVNTESSAVEPKKQSLGRQAKTKFRTKLPKFAFQTVLDYMLNFKAELHEKS